MEYPLEHTTSPYDWLWDYDTGRFSNVVMGNHCLMEMDSLLRTPIKELARRIRVSMVGISGDNEDDASQSLDPLSVTSIREKVEQMNGENEEILAANPPIPLSSDGPDPYGRMKSPRTKIDQIGKWFRLEDGSYRLAPPQMGIHGESPMHQRLKELCELVLLLPPTMWFCEHGEELAFDFDPRELSLSYIVDIAGGSAKSLEELTLEQPQVIMVLGEYATRLHEIWTRGQSEYSKVATSRSHASFWAPASDNGTVGFISTIAEIRRELSEGDEEKIEKHRAKARVVSADEYAEMVSGIRCELGLDSFFEAINGGVPYEDVFA